MTGVLWAATSGIGFGLFQTVNARALRQVDDPYLSTFVQLLTAAFVMLVVCAGSGDLARLPDATSWAIGSFALAGGLHFFVGWTLLNLSQERIGAARTSPLLTTIPLFGLVIAAVTLGELPTVVALVGIALMVGGAYVVAAPGTAAQISWRDALLPLATAFMWALSPIFTVEGLEELDSPLLGVAIGLVFSAAAYALVLAVWPRRRAGAAIARGGISLKLVAGVLVALATWGRWAALDLTAVGVVLALNLLAVPVVLLLAPLIAGRHLERVTVHVWLGATLIIGGSLVLIAAG